MIIYSPLDGDALTSSIRSNPRHCFLMTRLGDPVPAAIEEIRLAVSDLCGNANYTVIDARSRVTGRDFLMKIWRLIASAPLSIGICHEDIPATTQANIYYELGVAQGAREGDPAHQVFQQCRAKRFHQDGVRGIRYGVQGELLQVPRLAACAVEPALRRLSVRSRSCEPIVRPGRSWRQSEDSSTAACAAAAARAVEPDGGASQGASARAPWMPSSVALAPAGATMTESASAATPTGRQRAGQCEKRDGCSHAPDGNQDACHLLE